VIDAVMAHRRSAGDKRIAVAPVGHYPGTPGMRTPWRSSMTVASSSRYPSLTAGRSSGAPLGQQESGERRTHSGFRSPARRRRRRCCGTREHGTVRLGRRRRRHILKLPIGVSPQGIDLSTSVENEWLCAQIVREYGIPVAPCRIETFGERKTLVVERFDRQLAADGAWWLRLPQEDFCQSTATPPALNKRGLLSFLHQQQTAGP